MGDTTLNQLMEEKLENAKKRFRHYLEQDIELMKRVESITAPDVIAQLLIGRSYWSLIEERREDVLLNMLGLAAPEDLGTPLARIIDSLSPDDKLLLWRYADFFLECVKRSIE